MLRFDSVRLFVKGMPTIPLPGIQGLQNLSERHLRETQTHHRDLVAKQSAERWNISKDESPAPERFIGVDLGTTNSCVSYIDSETKRPKIIPSPSGSWVFPSSITFEPSHEKRTFGELSRAHSMVSGGSSINSGKRLIGRRFGELEKVGEQARKTNTISVSESGEISIEVGVRLYSVVHLTGMFLRYLKNEAESFLKEPVGGIVVSVPAYFTPQQKVATEDAALIAGFDVLEVIDEPTAACLTYTLLSDVKPATQSSYKLVFDLGGGTLDCALMFHDHHNNSFQVIATHGDPLLGGNDWDAVLSRRFLEAYNRKWKIDAETDHGSSMGVLGVDQRALLLEAEKAKIHFTNSLDPYRGHHRAFHFSAKHREILPLDTQLTLSEYLSLTEPLRERCTSCLDRLFEATTVKPSQVDQILLVGGMTRDPPVRMLLEKYFGRKVTEESFCPPDYAVAIGAAVRGGMLKGLFPQLNSRTQFIAGTTQANNSGGLLQRAWSKVKSIQSTNPTAIGVRWRGRVKGLSDEKIAEYARELVENETKQARQKQLQDADDAANRIMQRVANDATKRHDYHDKRIRMLTEQLKFWQYMMASFRDYEDHLLRTVGELKAAMDSLQGRGENTSDLKEDGTIDFDDLKSTPLPNPYKTADPYTSAALARDIKEKRIAPILDPEQDPTKVIIGGPKVLRHKLPLPGNINDEAQNNILHSGHAAVGVPVSESMRSFLLKSTVENAAWHEPPPPEGETSSWRLVKEAITQQVPIGEPVKGEELPAMTLEAQLQWLLENSPIDELPSDVHRQKRDQVITLSTILVK